MTGNHEKFLDIVNKVKYKEMTYDELKNISILMQVAYKGVIELLKTDKLSISGRENIEESVQNHYQMLTGLIERAQKGEPVQELSNSDISLLEGLIDTSTLGEVEVNAARHWIEDMTTHQDYEKLKIRLEANQQSPLKERGVGSAKDIHNQLDNDIENPRK